MADVTTASRGSSEDDLATNGGPETDYFLEHPCLKSDFDNFYQFNKPHKPALRNSFKRYSQCRPKPVLQHLFPALVWLTNYNWRSDFLQDVTSGITVAIMHIPQGMAYAVLGGVAPVVGIYMAFFPVLLYVLMGTSRHISMGTFAVLCMMTSKSVMMYSDTGLSDSVHFDSSNQSNLTFSASFASAPAIVNATSGYSPIQVATAVCLTVGMWQLLLGLLHLGVTSVLLSETLVSGFTTGAAVHVATSQLSKLIGVQAGNFTGPFKVIYTLISLFEKVPSTNPAAAVVSVITIVILMIFNECIKPRVAKKTSIPVPIELLLIITGTTISKFGHFHANYDISVIGDIPTGLPAPAIPPFELIPKVLVDGLVIAIIAFTVNMSMASIFSRKLNYSIDANQELLASGCSNIFASFFSCMPFGASLSRSMIQFTVGGKTQLASVVSCLLLLVILLFIGPFFEPLPNCILASIVVVSLKSMFMQAIKVPGMWRKSTLDGIVWMVTFLSVVILDIDYGLGMGLTMSLLSVLIMGQNPTVCRLGNIPGTNIYLDISLYHAAVEIPGICILQVAGGLHFANHEHVQRKLYRLMGDIIQNQVPLQSSIETPLEEESKDTELALVNGKMEPSPCVVLDMGSICFIDPSATKSLVYIYEDVNSKGIKLYLADCSATVCEQLGHCDFFSSCPNTPLFPSVHDAVLFAHQVSRNP